MFTSFSKIDKRMETRVLISWKGRTSIEKSNKYRNDCKYQVMYANFCDVIHNNPCLLSTFRLRIDLIRILNYKMPFRISLNNILTHLFSKYFNISDLDRYKIISSWNIRTSLEKNMNYIHSETIKNIYEHTSNILHGELEKHSIDYIKECEFMVDKFFEELRSLKTYKLKYNQTSIDFNIIKKVLKKKLFKSEKIRESNIYFFKSTYNNRKVAFIENNTIKMEEIIMNKYLILKHGSKDLGVFEYVDNSKVYNLFRIKETSIKEVYEFFYTRYNS